MLRIGSLRLENHLIMAPMAGITNLPFRLIVKGFGAGLVTTEMVSGMGLVQGHKKSLNYLLSNPVERPVAGRAVCVFRVSCVHRGEFRPGRSAMR